MLKIKPFKIDHEVLRNALKEQEHKKYIEQYKKSLASPLNPFGTRPDKAPDFEAYWQYIAGRMTDEQLEKNTTEVKETWINPGNIRKILRCSNTALGKNFLKITMDNGEKFFVEANSIQEFMMKNVILGNEVS